MSSDSEPVPAELQSTHAMPEKGAGTPSPAPTKIEVIKASFVEGSLGLALGDNRLVGQVNEGSQAAQQGVLSEDLLTHVGDVEVSTTSYADILNMIKTSPRPLSLTFVRLTASGSGGANKGMTGEQAKAAVRKAGNFMKGLLNSSVQLVQAFDKAIDRAIDDGTKQVAHAARATVRDLSHSKKRATMKIKSFDAKTAEVRTKADPDSDKLFLFHEGQQQRLKLLQDQNSLIVSLATDIDAGVAQTSMRMRAYVEQSKTLDKVLAEQVPQLVNVTRAANERAAHLKELLTALEGRLTALAVAKLNRHHETWVTEQQQGVQTHKSALESSLSKTKKQFEADASIKAAAEAIANSTTLLTLEHPEEESTPTSDTRTAQSSIDESMNAGTSGSSSAVTGTAVSEGRPPSDTPSHEDSQAGRVKEIARMFDAKAQPAASSKGSNATVHAKGEEEDVAKQAEVPVAGSGETAETTVPVDDEKEATTTEPAKEKKKGKGKKKT